MSMLMLVGSSLGQPRPPQPTSTLVFTVTDGACLPATVEAKAGYTAVEVSLASSNAQQIKLAAADQKNRFLFEHTQVGSSERWRTMIYLPTGTYELKSSLNGSKCTIAVQ